MKKVLKNSLGLALILLSFAACKKTDDAQPSSSSASVSHIELTGEDNMRDLGSYYSTNGKKVKSGLLYRSGELSTLTPADVAKLDSLGIRRVIDLRTSSERTSQPDKELNKVVKYNLSLISDVTNGTGSTSQLMGQIISGQVTAEQYMLPLYVVDSLKIANWKIIFDALQTGTPTLFHCTAGKDRTGMTGALILSALDVPRDTVVADFMKSNIYLSKSIEGTISQINTAYGGGKGEKLRPLLGVEESYINAFFKDIETKYGTVDNFLTNVLGIDKEEMKKIYLQ